MFSNNSHVYDILAYYLHIVYNEHPKLLQKGKLQTNEPTIMNELLKLGILRQTNGQITLDEGFMNVLQAEMCSSRTDHRQSLINIIRRYFPNLDDNSVLGFTAFIETYMLQN